MSSFCGPLKTWLRDKIKWHTSLFLSVLSVNGWVVDIKFLKSLITFPVSRDEFRQHIDYFTDTSYIDNILYYIILIEHLIWWIVWLRYMKVEKNNMLTTVTDRRNGCLGRRSTDRSTTFIWSSRVLLSKHDVQLHGLSLFSSNVGVLATSSFNVSLYTTFFLFLNWTTLYLIYIYIINLVLPILSTSIKILKKYYLISWRYFPFTYVTSEPLYWYDLIWWYT